jgi:4-hydroxybenzoate polyprenyltransferase/phosphoserine phosphatase
MTAQFARKGDSVREVGRTMAPPLFVDLDGTLVATDTLQEVLLLGLRRRPLALFRALRQLMRRGRAGMKQVLSAEDLYPDVALLPYRVEVLRFLEEERKRGRMLFLATASHASVARRVADHLGLFDGIVATETDVNLKGVAKLEAIERLCADRGWGTFAYMGDSSADLPLWTHAQEALVVGGVRLPRGPQGDDPRVERRFEVPGRRLGALAKALRPHHWLKNLLVFLPILLAHTWGDPRKVLAAALAFVAFSLVASAVYVTNDLVDLDSDRRHPSKRRRPFASGDLPVSFGPPLAVGLMLGGLVLAWLALPIEFVVCLLGYLVLTVGYSFWFKGVLLVDVFLLAGLYTFRLLGGGYATTTPISEWLMAFSGFFFLSLAFAKRYAELRNLREAGASTRAPGRSYLTADLGVIETVGPTSGYVAVLVLALYINSSQVALLYTNPLGLWLLCPLVLYWITRVWFLAQRGDLHEDPVIFALHDPISLVTGLFAAALVMIATAGWGPTLPGAGTS